ncbi:MAG: hypothetical protein WCI89_03890 [bacterium]
MTKHEKMKWLLVGFAAASVLLLILHACLEFQDQRSNNYKSHHGAVGVITNVTLPTITLKTRSGESQTIRIGTSTPVLSKQQTLSTTSLSVGQNVVIVGEPGEARFIRILP